MKLLCLCPYPEVGASSRYRVYQYRDKLSNLGIELRLDSELTEAAYRDKFKNHKLSALIIATVMQSFIRRLFRIRYTDKSTLIMIHRKVNSRNHRLLDRIILPKNRNYVFDMDDAVFTEYPIDHLLKRCAAVTVGNRYLADYVERAAPGVPVTIIPTTVDTSVWTVAEQSAGGALVVGWIGTGSTFRRYLQPVLTDLVRVSREHGAEFRVIAGLDVKEATEAAGAVFVPWSLETEVREVQAFDIGVMPLHDDEYVRGKCAFKLIQYGAVGIPSVGTDIGANGEVVQNGVTGYLTASAADMVSQVGALLQDAPLRERMGRAARQVIEQKFSLESQVPVLADVFRRVAEEAQRVRY